MALLLNFFTTPISVAFIVFNQRFLFLNKTKIVIKKMTTKSAQKLTVMWTRAKFVTGQQCVKSGSFFTGLWIIQSAKMIR